MKTVNLGTFESKGDLLVIDPGIPRKHGFKVEALPGVYSAFLTYGKMKKPFFRWDDIPGNYRNSKLMVVHEKHLDQIESLTFTKLGNVTVDSGQVAVLIDSNFKKNLKKPIDLANSSSSFYREQISSAWHKIIRNREALKDKEKNDLYVRMSQLDFLKGKKLIDYFNHEIIMAEDDICDSLEILKTKKYPSYIKDKKTKVFYDIICDLSSSEFHGGIHPEYGVNVRSGVGDGGYDASVCKKNGKVIAISVEFLSEKEMDRNFVVPEFSAELFKIKKD